MPVDPVRDAAVDVLLRVFERGIHLEESLDKTIRRKGSLLSPRGRRFLSQICYGTVRHRLLCDHVLSGLCEQPLDDLPPAVLVVLRMAIFQSLFCSQVTRPAMVHTSVDLSQKRGHAGLARMTNAILRKAPETLENIAFPDPAKDMAAYLRLRYSLPRWMAREWVERFGPEGAERFCARINTQAPMSLRVNTAKTTPEELARHLEKSGILTAHETPIPEELTVSAGGNPIDTRWFEQGHFLVQDPASMLPPRLLEPQPGEQVFDLCAAPGGKSTHIPHLTGGGARLTAMDAVGRRLWMVRDNFARLDMPECGIVCGDGTAPPFAAGQFDRVLVDAPCSGLGTLRRHPDLKWRVTPETVARLAETQRTLLRRGLDLCKNGGLVVYSVCTFTRQETVETVNTVLTEGLCEPEDGPELLAPWKTAQGQYQTDPLDGALDAFFLMRFRKRS